jgi:hypothetical protein
MMGGGQAGGGQRGSGLVAQTGSRAVQFSRSVTAADTTFASTTITFPRSSKPEAVFAGSTVAVSIQVQGNGVEFYGGALVPNVPLRIPLDNFPETTSLTIQTEILAAGAVAGSVFYT